MTPPSAATRAMTASEFLAFYEARPEGERWELIDGAPLMMTPPLIAHQRIASNVERLLNDLFERQRLPFVADREIGIEVPGAEHFRPEPEITVVAADTDVTRRHVDRFAMVVEVLSPSDKAVIGRKIAFYRAHSPCKAILLLQPLAVRAELHLRDGGGWAVTVMTDLADMLAVPAFGEIGSLRQIYARTGLAQG